MGQLRVEHLYYLCHPQYAASSGDLQSFAESRPFPVLLSPEIRQNGQISLWKRIIIMVYIFIKQNHKNDCLLFALIIHFIVCSVTCFSKALGTSLRSSDRLWLMRSRRRFSIICRWNKRLSETGKCNHGRILAKQRGALAGAPNSDTQTELPRYTVRQFQTCSYQTYRNRLTETCKSSVHVKRSV